MEFRVTLRMAHFFADHRALCRLLITKNMKKVKDILNHISRMFQISTNFYLTCNGLYLPELEDANVLQEGDIVMAIPHTNKGTVDQLELNDGHINASFAEKSSRKLSMNEIYVVDLISPLKKASKRTMRDVETEIEHDVVESSAKKKKQKKNKNGDLELAEDKNNEESIDNAEPSFRDNQDNLENVQSKKTKSKDRSSDVVVEKQGVEYEVNLDTKPTSALTVTKKKVLELLPISTKPNIVRAVRVYDDDDLKSTESKNDANDRQAESSSCSDETNVRAVELANGGIGPQKPKRKRVRKRKNKNKINDDSFVDLPAIEPAITESSSTTHIRFRDEPSATNDTVSAELEITERVDVADGVNYKKMCAEEIVKFPIMEGRFPKQGDIVAFKLYVLSNSYTPEISNFVVAKVMRYCPDTSKVFLRLLEGGEQCREPEGKFFIGDKEEVKFDEEYEWTSLFEPRLLFP